MIVDEGVVWKICHHKDATAIQVYPVPTQQSFLTNEFVAWRALCSDFVEWRTQQEVKYIPDADVDRSVYPTGASYQQSLVPLPPSPARLTAIPGQQRNTSDTARLNCHFDPRRLLTEIQDEEDVRVKDYISEYRRDCVDGTRPERREAIRLFVKSVLRCHIMPLQETIELLKARLEQSEQARGSLILNYEKDTEELRSKVSQFRDENSRLRHGARGHEDRALELEVRLQEASLAHEVEIEKRVKEIENQCAVEVERVEREVDARHSRPPYSTTASQTEVPIPRIPLSYANVAVQTEKSAITSAPRPPVASTPLVSRAFVIHGVTCRQPMDGIIQGVARTLKTGPRILGARWLLNPQRRKGKATSSIVVFLQSTAKYSEHIWIWGRRHSVEVYEFDRR